MHGFGRCQVRAKCTSDYFTHGDDASVRIALSYEPVILVVIGGAEQEEFDTSLIGSLQIIDR